VLDLSLALLFQYADAALGRVIAEMEHEREQVLGGAIARRSETIRLLLDGAPLDSGSASARLSYDLGRHHTALVLWSDGSDETAPALEPAAASLAQAAGSRRPLTLAAGVTTLWAWIGSDAPLAAGTWSRVRADDRTRIAVGPTQKGVTGFRRSHEAALSIQRLLAGNPEAGQIATYGELEITALAAHDVARAGDFVNSTLGPLGADTPAAQRLRETLRVYLEEAENAPRAAARLHTHRNTILQRVARATELLGYPPGDKRLAVELALELRRHLGARASTELPRVPG
jgi:DNA-binding PucR family transcriptional regulator